MTSPAPPSTTLPDLLTLANSSLATMVASLEADLLSERREPEDELVPAPSRQIAELILSEAVRLIRLGTRGDLSEAALLLARTRIRAPFRRLAEREPETYERVLAAALATGTASSPSARGSELNVLASWNGKALEAVRLISEAPGETLSRQRLRERLGSPSDSYLSHLLADLEAAGLIVRIRESRTITVHLGPVAREEHVRERLPRHDLAEFWSRRESDEEVTFHPPLPRYNLLAYSNRGAYNKLHDADEDKEFAVALMSNAHWHSAVAVTGAREDSPSQRSQEHRFEWIVGSR